MTHPGPLELVGVVHLTRPTGERADDLATLAAVVSGASPGTLFHHTVQHRLRFPSAGEPPADDFSNWVGGALQDLETAERLAFAIQDRGHSAAETRAAVLEVLGGAGGGRHAPEGGALLLLEAEPVPVRTGIVVESVPELFDALAVVDPGVWFYHLVERPWFGDASLSFAAWLRAHGETRRAAWFEDPRLHHKSIESARAAVLGAWRRSRVGARAVEAARQPEGERREAGRSAVASLVRRLTTPGDES